MDTLYIKRMKDYLEQYVQINKGYDPIQVSFDFDPVEN